MNITFINRMMGIKFGGGENFDLNIARALKKMGHNIRFVIGVADGYAEPVNLEDEFEVIKIKTLYLRDIHYRIKPTNFIKRIVSASIFEFDNLLFQLKAYKYLEKDNWSDIYQICGRVELGAWLNKKKIREKRNFKTVVRWPGPPSKRKLKWMKKCDINFANGDALRIIKANLLSTCREVPLGIDINKFYPIDNKKNKSKIEFLFVGRIVPIKNLSFLIKSFLEAVKENSNLFLKIVGDGDSKEIEKLKKLSENSANISFLGKKDGKDLIKEYQNSDIFCLTSNYDNFPNVIFEAMASGLAIIATKVGGIPMQVEDGKNGILLEPNDIIQLKNAILKLANDKELREKMGKAARERVEKEFSWDKSAEKLENIYMNC